MSRVTIVVRLKFIGLFTLSHGGNCNQQRGRVPSMWPTALCSGLVALSCGRVELSKNPPTLKIKNKKKNTKSFSGSLNVMVGYLCAKLA